MGFFTMLLQNSAQRPPISINFPPSHLKKEVLALNVLDIGGGAHYFVITPARFVCEVGTLATKASPVRISFELETFAIISWS